MKMLELGHITQGEYDEAYAFVDSNSFEFNAAEIDYSVAYEWFVYPALDQVREDLKEKYKYTDEEVSKLYSSNDFKQIMIDNFSSQVLNDDLSISKGYIKNLW